MWVRSLSWEDSLEEGMATYSRKSHEQRSLVHYGPWNHTESNMTDVTDHTHTHTHTIKASGPLSGRRLGNLLQCSCLENPRDGGAWWAAVYGVTQSWIQLKRLISSSILFSMVAASVIFPPTVQESSLLSTPSPAFILCRFFDDAHSGHYGFDLHFSYNEWCWASFHVFDDGASSLEKFKNVGHFTNLHVILVQRPCQSLYHSSFSICAAKVSTLVVF